MFQTSNEKNHVLVDLKLSIGQCKLIGRIVDIELASSEAGTSEFDKNALERLLDVFWAKIDETIAESANNDHETALAFVSSVNAHHHRGANRA